MARWTTHAMWMNQRGGRNGSFGSFDSIVISDRPPSSSVGGALADNLPRILLELDALEGRLADEAVTGPAGELGADHELRTEPVGVPSGRPRNGRVERRGLGRERRNGPEQLGPVGVREGRPDLA